MNEEERELIKAYGYTEEFHKPKESKFRFRSEHTWFDIWFGKKRTSMAVYDREIERLIYKYPKDIEEIEDILVEIE